MFGTLTSLLPSPPLTLLPCALFSAESNMEYPIGSPTCWNASDINCTGVHNGAQCGFGCTQDAGQTITAMAEYDSGMRLFNVGNGHATTPQPEMKSGEWKTPSAMGGSFSATCWFYGRDIYNAMPTKVPVGLISTFVGGTPVEHWTSPEGLATCDGPNPWDWAPGFQDSILWNGAYLSVAAALSPWLWPNSELAPQQWLCRCFALSTLGSCGTKVRPVSLAPPVSLGSVRHA